MGFGLFVKKFITFFVEPLGMVLTLMFIGIYLLYRNRHKYALGFIGSGLFLLLLFSYPPFSNLLVTNLESQYKKYDYIQSVKYIHVLGNGHNTDQDQPISSQLTSGGTQRVLEGVILYKNIPNSTIIFTGYEGKTNTTNAEMNSRLALALEVKQEEMIINGEPVDTREEAEYAKSIIGEEPFALVTSATHMPRAMMLFRAYGMNPIPAPTNFYKYDFGGYLIPPSAHSFEVSTIAMHEYFGMIYEKIKNFILI